MSVKQSPHEEYDRGFSNGWDACAARAQPAQAGQVLTDEEIQAAWVEHGLDDCAVEDFARAIEAAVLAKRVPSACPTCDDAGMCQKPSECAPKIAADMVIKHVQADDTEGGAL